MHGGDTIEVDRFLSTILRLSLMMGKWDDPVPSIALKVDFRIREVRCYPEGCGYNLFKSNESLLHLNQINIGDL